MGDKDKDKELIKKLANVPLMTPGFEALGMSAPIIVQMNPDGKWENSQPDDLDEERLKAVVAHLVQSNALSAAQSYCCQCAAENKVEAGNANYVPVIMMPIYSADQCPFDMECEIEKMKETETKPKKAKAATGKEETAAEHDDKEQGIRKKKKRGFVMQRLTNFDLLSQW